MLNLCVKPKGNSRTACNNLVITLIPLQQQLYTLDASLETDL